MGKALTKRGLTCVAIGLLALWGFEALGQGVPKPPGSKGGPLAKISSHLVALHGEYQSFLSRGGKAQQFHSPHAFTQVKEGFVVVDAIASADPGTLHADLQRLGARNLSVFGRMVSARLPLAAILHMAPLGSLKFVRPSYRETNTGAVTSQGDTAQRSDLARTAFGVDGTGVTVGVLSDSFDCQGGAAADVVSGDLPPGIVVLQEESDCGLGTDEGRAMMQIIHDVAPGASQAFHTAVDGQADFANGIKELAEAGATVIVDDVGYFAEPFFQDGIIAQAVDIVKSMGVSYFSSAGNSARRSYESAFRPGTVFDPEVFSSPSGQPAFRGGTAHDFDPGPGVDAFQKITVPAHSSLIFSLQWDSPFASACVGCPGTTNDLDWYLLDDPPTKVLLSTADDNIASGDPVELFFWNTGSSSVTANFMIVKHSGPDPGLLKYIRFRGAPPPGITTEFSTDGSTVKGHANAVGAEAVGAAFYGETPEFGVNPPLLEPFSSAGPTPILFDTSGVRLATPEIRAKPNIVAPDGANTTFFFEDDEGDPSSDVDTFPNFFGTSASAPHAAGVAALMLDANASLSPDAVYTALESTTIDMLTPGFDFDSGFGLIQADAAVEAVLPVCGNEIVEGSEQCDDGNTNSGDGCSATCQNENRPPVARCQNITVSATNACQVAVTAQQVDNGSSDPDNDSLTFSLQPAGPFSLGPQPVTLTVTDIHNASDQCTATVTVADTTPPSILCPADQTVSALSSSGAVVTYAPTATDNCSATVTCTPPSGSTFPIGTTPVSCTATDGGGLTASCNFAVKVQSTDLAVTKQAPASLVVKVGGQVNLPYTMKVKNTGPGVASGVMLSDPLPSGTTFVSAAAGQGSCSTPAIGSGGTVSCNLGTLASGATATVTLVVKVKGGLLGIRTITNTATVSAGTFDPNSANNAATAKTTAVTVLTQ